MGSKSPGLFKCPAEEDESHKWWYFPNRELCSLQNSKGASEGLKRNNLHDTSQSEKEQGAELHRGEEGTKEMYLLGSHNGLNCVPQKDPLKS